MRTTILYTVHNNYLIFRASVESLLANVPKDHYTKLLIVDDCSSEEALLRFIDQLSSDFGFVEVVHTGEPANLSYYNKAGKKGLRIYDGTDGFRGDRRKGGSNPSEDHKISKGHGVSINIGLDHVKTDFVLTIDSDILFTDKSKNMIPEMEACMDMDESIMNTGALFERIDGVRVFDKPFDLRDTYEYAVPDKIAERGGWPAFVCGMTKMSGWREHLLPLMDNGGWIHCNYSNALFEREFKTCNFNVFKDGYLIHLGSSTVRIGRSQFAEFYFSRDDANQSDTERKQLARLGWYKKPDEFGYRGSSWWYGHYKIPYTTKQFMKILEDTYAGLSFSTRKNVVTFKGES